MSVFLTPVNPKPEEAEETVHISNGEWHAIVSAAIAFGVNTMPFTSHDSVRYTPEMLREIADRIEQLKDAPGWLRWLADCGGANLS